MKDITAIIKASEHANQDSFSFRFGYYFLDNSEIELSNVTRINDENIRDPERKYGVRASFKLPDNNKTFQAKFILLKRNNFIVTVIREGGFFKTEEVLSETLRTLRENGDITPNDNIQMFKKNIKSHVEVIQYLSNKIGSNKVTIALDDAKIKIEKISEALRKSNQRADNAEIQIDQLQIKNKELQNSIEESSNKNKVQIKNTDWRNEAVTSGVFYNYKVSGDYLVVSLYTNNENQYKLIRCKNTHIGDYDIAVQFVKHLERGDMVAYTTRGANDFGSDWFYKIEKD